MHRSVGCEVGKRTLMNLSSSSEQDFSCNCWWRFKNSKGIFIIWNDNKSQFQLLIEKLQVESKNKAINFLLCWLNGPLKLLFWHSNPGYKSGQKMWDFLKMFKKVSSCDVRKCQNLALGRKGTTKTPAQGLARMWRTTNTISFTGGQTKL